MRIHTQKMDLLVGSLLLRPYVFLFLAAFLVAGRRDLGLGRTLRFGAVVWPIAWLAEFCSTRVGVPFGLYHYTGLTRGQELYIADMPFFDSLSFTFLAYAAVCLARYVLAGPRTSAIALAVVTGLLMMLLDVVIDPVAVRGERWFLGRIFYYPDGGVYFGVPLSNFAGWWLVGAVGTGLYRCIEGSAGPRTPAVQRGRVGAGIALYYGVLAFNLAVTAWIGEWRLLAAGLAVHALLALTFGVIVRRRPAPSAVGTGEIEQV